MNLRKYQLSETINIRYTKSVVYDAVTKEKTIDWVQKSFAMHKEVLNVTLNHHAMKYLHRYLQTHISPLEPLEELDKYVVMMHDSLRTVQRQIQV